MLVGLSDRPGRPAWLAEMSYQNDGSQVKVEQEKEEDCNQPWIQEIKYKHIVQFTRTVQVDKVLNINSSVEQAIPNIISLSLSLFSVMFTMWN